MAKIRLATGRGKEIYTLIDDEDVPLLKGKVPRFHKYGYVYLRFHQGAKRKNIWLHRFIMNPPSNLTIDHINRDKLDNRRENLRICTIQENIKNRGPRRKK